MKVCKECKALERAGFKAKDSSPRCRECGEKVCSHIGRGYDLWSHTTLCQANVCRAKAQAIK